MLIFLQGAGIPTRPKKDDDMSAGLARPYLTLEDKANTKNNNIENASRTTPNENRSKGYGKTSTSEVAKTKGRSSGPSTPLHKDSGKGLELASNKDTFTYYSTSLEKHHRNWNDNDYFCQIYKEHFIQSFQALTFCKYLRPVDPKVLAQKKVFLPKKGIHKGNLFVKVS